jgi:hypothetical protein
VHAYNMLQGHQCLTPERLQSHTRDVMQLDDMYLHKVHLTPTDLCTTQGDFSLHCLNHYCLTTKNRAFIGKRVVFLTPVEVIYGALAEHGHQGLLLTADNSGINGHFTAIKRHANGQFYVYDSLQCTVAELNEAYLQGLRDPKEGTSTLLLLEIPRYATYSTAPQGLQSLLEPPALRDALGSTSPWEHVGTLSVRSFHRQTGGSGLPVAINNAVGSQLVSPQDLMHSGAETSHDPLARHPDSPGRSNGGGAVPDFNAWASQRNLCTCASWKRHSISLDAHGKLPSPEPPPTAQHKVGARARNVSPHCPTAQFSISRMVIL